MADDDEFAAEVTDETAQQLIVKEGEDIDYRGVKPKPVELVTREMGRKTGHAPSMAPFSPFGPVHIQCLADYLPHCSLGATLGRLQSCWDSTCWVT